MNKLNRKLEYSLMALKHMSQKIPGELTTAKEVADAYHTPFDASARVMQQLAQKGFLKSEQGAFGGYQIIQDLGKLTLYDLMEVVSGPIGVVKCTNKEDCDIQSTCNIVSPIQILNQKMAAFYKGISLKELLLESPTTSNGRGMKKKTLPEGEHHGSL